METERKEERKKGRKEEGKDEVRKTQKEMKCKIGSMPHEDSMEPIWTLASKPVYRNWAYKSF